MRRVFVIVALLLLFTTIVWAQSDAGFLDNTHSGDANWNGSGWYCIEQVPWPGQNYIVWRARLSASRTVARIENTERPRRWEA